jgi:glycosyltransferase involved in cell wall biosynthesis
LCAHDHYFALTLLWPLSLLFGYEKMIMSTVNPKIERICFLNPHGYVKYPPPLGKTDTGGQTLYEFELAFALAKTGRMVDIVTRSFDGMKKFEEIAENVRIVRIPCGPGLFVPKEKIFAYIPEMAKNLLYYIEYANIRYDIIHSHYWDAGYLGMLLSSSLVIPHVHTPHSLGKLKERIIKELTGTDNGGRTEITVDDYYHFSIRNNMEKKIMDNVDAYAVSSRKERKWVLEYYSIDHEKLFTIYPGIDGTVFNPLKTSVDQSLHLNKNAIVTVSRLVPAKGIDLLIEALKTIQHTHEFHLYIIGGTTTGDTSPEEIDTTIQIKSLIKKYHLEDRITCVGHVNHDTFLPAYYRNTKIFIAPSRNESFGSATLEALGCGSTILVSSVAGSSELIVNGFNGFTVDPRNTQHFANMIAKLLTKPYVRKKVGDNASTTITKAFHWNTVADNYILLYEYAYFRKFNIQIMKNKEFPLTYKSLYLKLNRAIS